LTNKLEKEKDPDQIKRLEKDLHKATQAKTDANYVSVKIFCVCNISLRKNITPVYMWHYSIKS